MTQNRARKSNRKSAGEKTAKSAIVLNDLPPPSPLRGLLPTPPEVAKLVAREVKRLPMTEEARRQITNDWTLQYYFGGHEIAYRRTPKVWRFWQQVWKKLVNFCGHCRFRNGRRLSLGTPRGGGKRSNNARALAIVPRVAELARVPHSDWDRVTEVWATSATILILQGLDQTLVRAVLHLQIRTGLRWFPEIPFVVDCAAALTSMSVAKATELGIALPRRAVELSVETAIGIMRQTRYPGRIQGKVVGLEGWTFDWPCHFVAHQGPAPKAVLGLAGVLDDLRIILDGTYALEAPYGWLILERRQR